MGTPEQADRAAGGLVGVPKLRAVGHHECSTPSGHTDAAAHHQSLRELLCRGAGLTGEVTARTSPSSGASPVVGLRTDRGASWAARPVRKRPAMTTTSTGSLHARATGGLFIAGAISFAAAATVLSATFDWPEILREPPGVVLPVFHAGGPGLVGIWLVTAWAYGILAVPILLLPAALGRPGDPVLRAATWIGAASVVLSVVGFLRWVFVVPPLARSWVDGDPRVRVAVEAAWGAQHQFGGALLGEHLGQVLAVAWSITVSGVILSRRILPAWLGVTGVVLSLVYLLNQGEVLATAVPGFPVWEPAGLLGSTGWGLWVAALGVVLLRRSRRFPGSPDRAASGEGHDHDR